MPEATQLHGMEYIEKYNCSTYHVKASHPALRQVNSRLEVFANLSADRVSAQPIQVLRISRHWPLIRRVERYQDRIVPGFFVKNFQVTDSARTLAERLSASISSIGGNKYDKDQLEKLFEKARVHFEGLLATLEH